MKSNWGYTCNIRVHYLCCKYLVLMHRAQCRLFRIQRSIPVIPQSPVVPNGTDLPRVAVSLVLVRGPVVKPNLHPIEVEFAATLERGTPAVLAAHARGAKLRGHNGKKSENNNSATTSPIEPGSALNSAQFFALRD